MSTSGLQYILSQKVFSNTFLYAQHWIFVFLFCSFLTNQKTKHNNCRTRITWICKVIWVVMSGKPEQNRNFGVCLSLQKVRKLYQIDYHCTQSKHYLLSINCIRSKTAYLPFLPKTHSWNPHSQSVFAIIGSAYFGIKPALNGLCSL